MKYLVIGSEGPGFTSPEEVVQVLTSVVLPSIDALIKLERAGKITGGLPVGDRAFVFIAEAPSHEELDNLLRELPMWGSLEWDVTPLQTFARRAAHERAAVRQIKRARR